MDIVLRVAQVRKRFGVTEALSNVDLEARRGSVLGLLGPNGAGKTTLIRMVLDLARPDAGRVEVLGGAPSAALRHRIGYLPEERGLYPRQRVDEVLAYLVSLAGVPRPEARRRAGAWLERAGLGARARSRVRELSKGMQQKVQLGAAVLHRPDLLILDEPFTGLDPVNRRLVSEVVREEAARGAAVIVSTHLLDQAQRLCDQVVLIRRGRVLLSGALSDVRASRHTASLSVAAARGWAAAPGVAPLVAGVEGADGHDRVTLAPGATPEALLAALVAAHVPVRHFSVEAASLEEVFVDVVEADTAEDAERIRAELRAGDVPPEGA